MTSIAWAIIFLSVCIADSFYTMKFGMHHEAGTGMGMLAIMALVVTIICTIIELRK